MTSGTNNPENGQPATGTVTPENNLALRYSYDQLDASHRVMADRVAALIVAYPDITRLNDPAKQRQLISEVMNSPIGRGARDQAGNAANAAGGLAHQIPVLRDVLDAADASRRAAQGVGDAGHAGATGVGTAVLPVTITAEAAGEFYNQLKVIGNNLSAEQARSLGAAYASVFQARAVERESKGIGAAVSSVDNFLAYGAASFAWIWDLARQIPIVGPLLQKLDARPTHTFDEHVRRATNDADVKATRENLTEAREIDGVDTRHWAEALTRGGAQQNRAGQDVDVVAPSKNDPVPTAPDAPMDAAGTPLVAAADNGAVLKDAVDKAGDNAGTTLAEHFRGIDTPQEWAMVAAGLAGAGFVGVRMAPTVGRAGVAVAHGAVRSGVSVARTAVAGVTGLTAGVVQGASDLIPGGKSGQFRAAEDALREAEMRRDVRQTRVDARQARVDELQAKPLAERTLADRAAMKVDEVRLGGAQNSLRAAEEGVGRTTARVAERAENAASIIDNGGRGAGRVQLASHLTENAGRIERMGDAASSAISRFASSRLGVESAEIAVRATRFGRVARFAGRMIPGVGLAATAAAVFIRPSDAHAEEYGSANYWQRLDRDHQQGKINDAEYASYRAMQSGFLATGLGGFITAGVTEVAQNGGEHLDRERMSRYMPPSLVETVTEMVDEHKAGSRRNDGALGRADAGIAHAAVEATQVPRAAQAQASSAARPLVRSQVAAVGHLPEAEEKQGFRLPQIKLPFKIEMPRFG